MLIAFRAVQAQTCTITIDSAITNPNPIPFGLNWAEANAARNLNALNNQTGDPGFGRQIVCLKGILDGGGTTYADHATGITFDYYETLYTGMFDGGTIRVYRETPTGIDLIRTSPILNFFADTLAPNHHRVTFASGAAVQAGDIYVLSQEATQNLNQYCHPRLTWIRDGDDTWQKVVNTFSGGNDAAVTKSLDAADKPANGGSTSCKIVNTDPLNLESGIAQYFSNSTTSGEFAFNPSKTYRFSVWLKQTGIAGDTVTLKSTTTNLRKTFTVTNTWQQYTYDVTGINPIIDGSPVDFLTLTFDGVGVLNIDNFLLYDLALPPFALRPDVAQALIDYKPYSLRIWSGQTNGEMGTNIGDWTDDELQSAKLWSLNLGPTPGASLKLPTILPICETNAIAPYLICSPSFAEGDFLGLMEYIYGASSTTMGAKRAAQGHAAPFNFPKVYIELGNETWNGLFAPWTYDFNGNLYGKFAQYFFNVIKTSPYYDPAKVELVVGGFFVQPDAFGYGQQAVITAPDAKQMMLANYVGGFDGLNIPASPTFADSIQQTAFYARWITRNLIDLHVATSSSMAANGNPYQLGIYEAGPGYALPNPNNPFDLSAERIGKSLGSAVANLDAFLYQSQKGFGLQNLFLFSPGFNWTSHTSYSNGYRPHNHFLAMQMRNRYATGQMITANIANNPTTYLPLIDGNSNGVYDAGQYGEAPSGDLENIASYVFKQNGTYSVFVINRNITTNTPVQLELPSNADLSAVTLYKLEGDPTQSNIDSLLFSINTQNLTSVFNSPTYNFVMPAGGIYLFKIGDPTVGVNAPLEPQNLFTVYPNPAKDEVKIETKETIVSVEIYNYVGQKVKTIQGNTKSINTSTLPNGTYVFMMYYQDKKVAKKVVLMR